MSSQGKVLVSVASVLAVVALVLGALVFRSVAGREDDAFAGEQSAGASSASATSATASPTASSSSSFETYALADGNCKTAQGVDYSDADAVATRFMEISYCFDSMVDRTMTAGMLRASDVMTDDFKQKLVEPQRNALQNQWTLATEHKAYTRPTVSDAPGDSEVSKDPSVVHQTKLVRWLWVGRDEASMDGGYSTVDLVLVKGSDGRWLVDEAATNVFEAK